VTSLVIRNDIGEVLLIEPFPNHLLHAFLWNYDLFCLLTMAMAVNALLFHPKGNHSISWILCGNIASLHSQAYRSISSIQVELLS
jgi:hypothetical protein